MVLREDRVPADISNCVVAESLAFVVNEDVHVILKQLLDNTRLLFLNREIDVFRQV